jgi:hypothetical protein
MDELSFNLGVGIVFGKKEPAAGALSRIVVNPPLTPPGPLVRAPNIYLYPTKPCNVKVTVEPNVRMVASSPFYNDGWNVRAYPDGSIPNTPGYLFYEALVNVEKPGKGWCISSTEVGPFFKKILKAYGLNDVEIRDFLDYWQIRLNRSPYYAVYPVVKETLDKVCPLKIAPVPDTVFRLWFYITPVPGKRKLSLEEPLVQQFERKGFVAVEWGGILESK